MIGETIAEAIFEVIIEFIVLIFVGILWETIFNFIGGTFRWIYGSIWRNIAGKPKYKFREYINGPDKPDEWFDNAHGWVNSLTGILILTIVIIAFVV